MKITNFTQLAVSEPRKALLSIAEAGLQAIDTTSVMREMVRIEGDTLRVANDTIDLKTVRNIAVVAIGKCATESAVVLEEVLRDRITSGVMVDVKGCPPLAHIKGFCGTHPLPSEANLAAAEEIIKSLEGMAENDLVLFVISGGGSTLLFLPEDRADRAETKIVAALMAAGATIQEMNIVRKHLSLARGGYLAKAAYPARVISLIMSDVPANDISFIASGPTVKDTTTEDDAAQVLAKYNILTTCGLERCGLIETPKEDRYFEKVTNILAISNVKALEGMKAEAERLGFRAEIRGSELTGEASSVAHMIANELHVAPSKTVLLWGGETTVAVPPQANGRGGRNLELSATALDEVREDEEILSLASDGRDHGPFAGAICDTITANGIRDAGIDTQKFLEDHDVYGLYEKTGNYLETGDTGSNVSDLMIALKN